MHLPSSSIFAIFVVIIAISTQQYVFAEKNIDYSKVLDVEKKSLELLFEDLNNLSRIYPDIFKSVDYNKNDNIAKITVNLNGFSLQPEIKYIDSIDDSYKFEIISGDLKGTKIATNLQETWGFDGKPNGGTIVDLKMTLQFSGLAYLLGTISNDDSLLYSIDRFLVDISHQNFNQDKKSQDTKTDTEKSKKAKGKRSR